VTNADCVAYPFQFYLLNAPQEVTVGTATSLTSVLLLDITFAGNADEAANVVFEYTRFGEVPPGFGCRTCHPRTGNTDPARGGWIAGVAEFSPVRLSSDKKRVVRTLPSRSA